MILKSTLAGAAALAVVALAASPAAACDASGPCGGPPPVGHAPAGDAWIASPGPTPAYKAGGGYSETTTTYEERSYDRYGEGEHRAGRAGRAGGGWGGRYGEVRKSEGYVAPYTPAFGHTVAAERPYTGPGVGYMVQHGPCGPCAAPPRPLPSIPHRHVVRRVHRAHHAPVVRHVHRVRTRVIKRIVERVIVEREVPRYIDRPVVVEREVDTHVSPDFFYGGINGGAGFGVDGGNGGGGGGGYAESGASAGSASFAYASASASGSAKGGGHGGWAPPPHHGMPPHGKPGCGCGGKGGKH